MSGIDKWSALMKATKCAWHVFGWMLIIGAVVYMVFNFVTGRPLFREDGLSIGWLIAIMLTLFANQKFRKKRRKSR
jgi:xanthine/uracil permease